MKLRREKSVSHPTKVYLVGTWYRSRVTRRATRLRQPREQLLRLRERRAVVVCASGERLVLVPGSLRARAGVVRSPVRSRAGRPERRAVPAGGPAANPAAPAAPPRRRRVRATRASPRGPRVVRVGHPRSPGTDPSPGTARRRFRRRRRRDRRRRTARRPTSILRGSRARIRPRARRLRTRLRCLRRLPGGSTRRRRRLRPRCRPARARRRTRTRRRTRRPNRTRRRRRGARGRRERRGGGPRRRRRRRRRAPPAEGAGATGRPGRLRARDPSGLRLETNPEAPRDADADVSFRRGSRRGARHRHGRGERLCDFAAFLGGVLAGARRRLSAPSWS